MKNKSMLRFICPPPALKTGSDVVGLRTAREFRRLGVDSCCHYLWPEFLAKKMVLGRSRILRKIYAEVACPVGLLKIMPQVRRGDVVWINNVSMMNKETNTWFEGKIIRKGSRYIYHLQDYWFISPLLEAAAGKRIEMADLTVVVSHELKRQVQNRYPDAKVIFLEEPIDVDRVHPVPVTQESGIPVLVWTGNPANLVNHFSELVEVLGEVFREVPFKLRVISGSVRPDIEFPFPMEWFPYSLEKESEYLSGAAAGLAPLEDTVYAHCKDVYKVKTYMAAGVVPLATGIGHCRQVIRHGETGFMFNSREAWKNGLIKILGDQALSRSMGRSAREYCVQHFSHQALMPVWLEALRQNISEEI